MRRFVYLALLIVALLPAWAQAKKKAKAVPPETKLAIERILDGKADAVADCIMSQAVKRGAKSVDVSAQLLINNHGQIFDCKITTKTDRGENPALATCVENVLRSATYPTSQAPLVSAERSWSYAR